MQRQLIQRYYLTPQTDRIRHDELDVDNVGEVPSIDLQFRLLCCNDKKGATDGLLILLEAPKSMSRIGRFRSSASFYYYNTLTYNQ